MEQTIMTDEQRLRLDLACALRWCARLNLHEGVVNHFSVATSACGKRFLMNPAGRHFSRMRPGDLLHLDSEGAADARADVTAWCLHGYFHRTMPHARCLMHTHMPYATALASLDGWRMLPIDQNACRFFNRVAYDDDFGGMLLAQEEAARQARVAGDMQVLVMRSHGVLVLADSVGAAFDILVYFEQVCRNQWLAMVSGAPLRVIADDIAEQTARQWEEYDTRHHFAELRTMWRSFCMLAGRGAPGMASRILSAALLFGDCYRGLATVRAMACCRMADVGACHPEGWSWVLRLGGEWAYIVG